MNSSTPSSLIIMENNQQQNNNSENNNYQNLQDNKNNYNKPMDYKKMGMWKWIVIYLVIALIVYGLVYYIILAMKGGPIYAPQQYGQDNSSGTALINQDLNSISGELDNVNVDQIDAGLNQNDSDANSF